MSTVKYKKPSGVIMEVRDEPAVRALAKNLNWEEVKPAKKKAAKKKAK